MDTSSNSNRASPSLPDDSDPIDMLQSSTPVPLVDEPEGSGRVLRRRQTVFTNTSLSGHKRAMGVLETAGERVQNPPKKLKVETSAVIASIKKASISEAFHKFLCHYRDIFKPLLPSNSNFFKKLEREYPINNKIIARQQLEEQPSLIQGGQMKDYQLQGLSYLVWMHENGMNSILGDEMGLGKTLQTLSLLAHIKEREPELPEPHLIICPLSVLSSWMNESARWLPSFKVLRFHGPVEERARLKEAARTQCFDLVVTTYDAYASDDGWFKTKRWTYCVLDEGHKIKDSKTNIAHKLQGLGAQRRLILTGTPIQNNLFELWSLLHWLYPSVFIQTTQARFQDAFDLTQGRYDPPFLNSVHQLLGLIMLRRTKETVEFSVPPLDEMVVFLPLTETQRFWYLRLLTRLDTVSLDEIFTTKTDDSGREEARALVEVAMSQPLLNKHGRTYKELMNLLMVLIILVPHVNQNDLSSSMQQLRRVCDHPYIVKGSFPEPYEIGEHIVASSTKFQFIDKLFNKLLPKGERVLCFSQWTGMLDMLEDYMALRNISYARLDGSVPRARRTLDIKLFQQEQSPYQVYLISTHAGGLGINLTKASHVVLCDSTWNPQIDLQAIARSHRIGQTKDVKVYRLICQDSVEDQMLDRLRRKLFLSCKVMTETDGDSNKVESALKTNELLQVLKRGTSALARWEGTSSDKNLSAFQSSSLEEILARSKRTEDLREFKIKREAGKTMHDETLAVDIEEEEKKLLSGIAQVQTRLFEGRHHKRSEKAFAKEWEEMQERAREDRPSLPKPQDGRKRPVFEHEDYCIECWDGGELLCCQHCPRVFHAACMGLPKDAHKLPMVKCSQHECAECGRKAADVGGMLFRCRSCPLAHCEDCLPEGDIAAIGPTLPELVILGYPEASQVYWVYCDQCKVKLDSDEEWRRDWDMKDRILSSA
ncbi:SNF2 family N-terminal domain-containing protein [Hysterangium stoloniferum]|nr:SNF2 family N-terminal domain-containing protein [Hysterangium stoloniferum]